jgi:salicylate hydroxylase
MIIQDAYVLATLLGHELTTLATLPHALEVYQKIRMPFAYDVGARSHQNARWFSLMDFKPNPSRSKQENLQELGRLVQSRWEWAWVSNPDADCNDAIRRLEAML